MKHLFTLLLTVITLGAIGQVSPPVTPKAGTKQATTNQAYIYRSGVGDTTRLYLRLGAPGITADYYEIQNGSGGGGSTIDTTKLMYLAKNESVTGFKAFKGRITVDNANNNTGSPLDVTSISTAPVIIASGSTGSKIFEGSTTSAIGVDIVNVSSTLPTLKAANLSNVSGGLHAQFGNTAGKQVFIENSGNIIAPKASASNHVVIKSQLDSLGVLVDSIGSLVDTTGSIKDFYADSLLTGTTTQKMLYADTLAANTLTKNGDKLIFNVAGHYETISAVSNNTFTVYFAGVNVGTFSGAAVTPGFRPFSLKVILMKAGATLLKVSSEFTYETQNDSGGAISETKTYYYQGTQNFTTTNVLSFNGQLQSAAVSLIEARMGYIEFKPAAL